MNQFLMLGKRCFSGIRGFAAMNKRGSPQASGIKQL
jgi:hypothetical protein